ncbi:hypothetical protein FMEXI_6699 [Fusarium mexicanum]|uniref:Uncharacterized protein n=1 Tax=Fusarium mexicanum TaxID=751941 RepID=A0A8H5IVF6_9HYPO|nr:hypothetical protein FMEXI_6699 [Fusarium mexicanum]
MKPVVSAFNAWSCTVLSVFAIVILSALAGLYRSNHEEFTGGVNDPEDGKAVSDTIFIAVLVYVVRPSTIRHIGHAWLEPNPASC